MQLSAALGVVLACVSTVPVRDAGELEWRVFEREGAPALDYAWLEPRDTTPADVRPLLFALPRGAQDRAAVESTLELLDAPELARRGWRVACPIAREGEPFFAGGADAAVALARELRSKFACEGGRVHVAGISNGGRSALRFALRERAHVASLSLLPGRVVDGDLALLEELVDTPVALSAGGDDVEWSGAVREIDAHLRELGARHVSLAIFAGEGHVPPSACGARFVSELERLRALELTRLDDERAIVRLLAEFHDAAAEADLEAYIGALAPGAVFIGTDETERWSKAEFRAFCEPYFARGQGWRYTAVERHVALAVGAPTAWFDERLANEKYGAVRGSGVVRKLGGQWRIAHYVMSFPVPNEVAGEVVERIRRGPAGR